MCVEELASLFEIVTLVLPYGDFIGASVNKIIERSSQQVVGAPEQRIVQDNASEAQAVQRFRITEVCVYCPYLEL